jgi:glycosyltransferase involved in cell wall biosynthesis
LETTVGEPLRVLHLDTGKEWRGGQQQLLYLASALTRADHDSLVVTPKGSPLAQRARNEGLPVREITCHGAGDPIAIHAVHQILNETGTQILHAHTANAHSLGFLVLRLPGTPKSRRPAFVIHRRVDFQPAADPLTRMRYTAEPCLYLCVSDAVRQVLERYGIPPARLRVVHSGIDPARIDAYADGSREHLRAELGVPVEAGVIGVIGALVPHKGHRHLIAALPRILAARPDACVVLFGEGPLEVELRRDCWERGVQTHVLFAGFRPDVARFLPAIDVYVHPSVEEGLGTTILDAMAARLPVVATRAGGIPEVVRHGETGWLVPPGAPTELAGPVISLLENPRQRAAFGEAGRARVESEFTIPRLFERTLSAYSQALQMRAALLPAPPAENS